MFYYCLLSKYLPAKLKANEGNIMNAVTNNSLINISKILESGVFGPDEVKTTKMPIIPKTMDE